VDINLEIRCQGWAAARVEILRADFIPSVQVLTSRSLYFFHVVLCAAVAGQLRSLEDDVRSAYAPQPNCPRGHFLFLIVGFTPIPGPATEELS
jgi:hypothetical protein